MQLCALAWLQDSPVTKGIKLGVAAPWYVHDVWNVTGFHN